MKKTIVNLSKLSGPLLFSLTIVLLLSIGFVDWITGNEVSISIFYLLPISIASWFINKWEGLIFALLSTIIWFLSDILNSISIKYPITPYWNAVVMLSFFMVVSLLLSSLRESIERENRLALKIQKSLLPQTKPQIPGFKIYSLWKPTKSVSGDYYDFLSLSPSSFGITLADVCGHGYSAALLMSNLQATFRIIATHDHSPLQVCEHLNNLMINYDTSDKYTSFFYGVLDIENKSLTYSNAGHPPPIILHNNGNIERLNSNGLLLGVDSTTAYEESIEKMVKGDVLLLYSDGIIETRNPAGEEFGESRLIQVLRENLTLQENEFNNTIIRTLETFSKGKIDDDVTLVIVFVS